MDSLIENIRSRAAEVPSQTWHWFNSLNREEWFVVLVVVCAFGFVCMLGFNSKRV